VRGRSDFKSNLVKCSLTCESLCLGCEKLKHRFVDVCRPRIVESFGSFAPDRFKDVDSSTLPVSVTGGKICKWSCTGQWVYSGFGTAPCRCCILFCIYHHCANMIVLKPHQHVLFTSCRLVLFVTRCCRKVPLIVSALNSFLSPRKFAISPVFGFSIRVGRHLNSVGQTTKKQPRNIISVPIFGTCLMLDMQFKNEIMALAVIKFEICHFIQFTVGLNQTKLLCIFSVKTYRTSYYHIITLYSWLTNDISV